ncbi:MAG: hypothetical protein KDB31_02595, partial [Microthrixaceae bacterium]|nr:hypothetical protein [Microthrixaceae bacterium]
MPATSTQPRVTKRSERSGSRRTEGPEARDENPVAPDDAEQRALVEAHLPLVNHVVFQVAVHFPRHVDRDDLINAGAIGLVEAARRYDESRGVPFNRF